MDRRRTKKLSWNKASTSHRPDAVPEGFRGTVPPEGFRETVPEGCQPTQVDGSLEASRLPSFQNEGPCKNAQTAFAQTPTAVANRWCALEEEESAPLRSSEPLWDSMDAEDPGDALLAEEEEGEMGFGSGEEGEEGDLLDSTMEESDEESEKSDPDYKIDLEGEKVRVFGAGPRAAPIGKLGFKISTGSYGWVYEFEPLAPAASRGTRRKEPPSVAKICHLSAGFLPSHLLRELEIFRLLDGHPGAPRLREGVWLGEVSLAAVQRARRKGLTAEEREDVEFDHCKTPDDRYVAILMEDAGSTLLRECARAADDELRRYLALTTALPVVLSVLSCLHSLGLSHRDIKLDNILVRRETGGTPPAPGMQVRLIDFGLGKRVLRRNSQEIGVLGYRAPETAHWDNPEYDERIDLYAVGCCFLVGMQPTGEDAAATETPEALQACLNETVERLAQSSYPGRREWTKALVGMLAPRASDRPTAEALLTQLDPVLSRSFRRDHLAHRAAFRVKAKRLLLPDPSKPLSSDRCAYAKWMDGVCRHQGYPKIVFTRAVELLDAVRDRVLPSGSLLGKLKKLKWIKVSLACVLLAATYFLSEDVHWDCLSVDYGVSTESLRAAHLEVASAASWVVLKAGTFVRWKATHGRDPENSLYWNDAQLRAVRVASAQEDLLSL